MQQIGFIGAGNMAGAIIGRMLAAGILPAERIAVCDPLAETRARYAEAGHPVFESADALTGACDTIVLSVKPQVFPEILPLVKQAMTREKLLVSIAAGIGAEYIQAQIGFPCKLVLVMPNTPILLGEGATSLCRIEPASAGEFEQIRQIFAAGGLAEEVAPDQMNAAMAVHGCPPAYIYLFAQSIVASAERSGIDPAVANRLFAQTLIGAARMMLETGKSHQELIDMVCSPGGTTLAGMAALREHGFVEAVEAAFAASEQRGRELAR